MNPDQKNNAGASQSEKDTAAQETVVASNPNPRANENIRERSAQPDAGEGREDVGSEITDGEDA